MRYTKALFPFVFVVGVYQFVGVADMALARRKTSHLLECRRFSGTASGVYSAAPFSLFVYSVRHGAALLLFLLYGIYRGFWMAVFLPVEMARSLVDSAVTVRFADGGKIRSVYFPSSKRDTVQCLRLDRRDYFYTALLVLESDRGRTHSRGSVSLFYSDRTVVFPVLVQSPIWG